MNPLQMIHINKLFLKHSLEKSVCYCKKVPSCTSLSCQKKRQTRCLLCIQKLKEKEGYYLIFHLILVNTKQNGEKKPQSRS